MPLAPAAEGTRLRPATAEDLPALVALEQAAFRGDRMSPRQYRRHLTNPHAAVWVAVDPGGTLLGSAVVFFRTGSPVARLYSIATASAARGRGIGSALLHAGEATARNRGCLAMRLEVREDNAGAIALYQRHGYLPIGRRAHYYEDGATALRLEKPLAAHAAGR